MHFDVMAHVARLRIEAMLDPACLGNKRMCSVRSSVIYED